MTVSFLTIISVAIKVVIMTALNLNNILLRTLFVGIIIFCHIGLTLSPEHFPLFALVWCCCSYPPPVKVTTVWCLMVWAVSHPQPGRSAWPGRAGERRAPVFSSPASWTLFHKNLLASDLWASSTLGELENYVGQMVCRTGEKLRSIPVCKIYNQHN